MHYETESEPQSKSVFDMYHIFDIHLEPLEEASLNWPRLLALDGTQSWTERIPAGVMVTRYVSEGTAQVKMSNEVSSSGRFMGSGSLIDVNGPVTLTWSSKHSDERVVILSPNNVGEPDKLVVAAGALTVLLGALLAHGLS